jgi:hypothetical protein
LEHPDKWKAFIPNFWRLRKFMQWQEGRVVVSIDPFSNIDDDFKAELMDILMKERKNIRNSFNSKNNSRTYNVNLIPTYIKWLETYDNFVKRLKELVDEKLLTVTNGAYAKPKDIATSNFIFDSDIVKKRDDTIQIYLNELFHTKLLKLVQKDLKKPFVEKKPKNFKTNIKTIWGSPNINDLVDKKFKSLEINEIVSYFEGNEILCIFNKTERSKLELWFDRLNFASLVRSAGDLRKVLEDNIKDAALLIQNVPNIQFSIPRISEKKNL